MEGERSLPCDTSSITKWFYREHLTVRSWHTSARLPNRKAYKGMPGIRFTNRFGSLQVSITGPVRLACLKAGDVVRFVQRQAPHLHLKRAKLLTTALRSFLPYARKPPDDELPGEFQAKSPSVGRPGLCGSLQNQNRELRRSVRNRHWRCSNWDQPDWRDSKYL